MTNKRNNHRIMKKILIILLVFVILEGALIALAAIYNFKVSILLISLIPLIYLWFALKKNSKKEE